MFYPRQKCYTVEMILMTSVETMLLSDIVAISSKKTNASKITGPVEPVLHHKQDHHLVFLGSRYLKSQLKWMRNAKKRSSLKLRVMSQKISTISFPNSTLQSEAVNYMLSLLSPSRHQLIASERPSRLA